jgi:YVTN family beta-propeller protein
LDHFKILYNATNGTIPTQNVGTPFDIRIIAKDSSNNTITAFDNISTGFFRYSSLYNTLFGISPTTTSSFANGNGELVQSVTLVHAGTDHINVTKQHALYVLAEPHDFDRASWSALDPANGIIYVPNQGTFIGYPTISILDTNTNTANQTAITGVRSGPYFALYDSVNNEVFVTNNGDDSVSVIDPVSNTIITTIPLGFTPFAATLDPDHNKIYVDDINTGVNDHISVIDANTNTLNTTITVGGSPWRPVYDHDNQELYVPNQDGTISIINTNTDTVIKTLTTTVNSGVFQGLYDSGNNEIYFIGYSSNKLYAIDTFTDTVIATTSVGSFPYNLALDTINHYIVTVNNIGQSISVIDDSTNLVINTITGVFQNPANLEFNSTCGCLFVASQGGAQAFITEFDTTYTSVGSSYTGIPASAGGGFMPLLYDSAHQYLYYMHDVNPTAVTAFDVSVHKSSLSNAFTVLPASLDHFDVMDTSGGSIGTQTAGIPFNIKIIARDVYNNTVISFNSTVTLTNSLGAISPTTTGSFVNGVLASQSVTLIHTGTDDIIATNGVSGTSNSFTVNVGTLDHFAITNNTLQNIENQSSNIPFSITITAQDIGNNTVTSFNNQISLTDDFSTLYPTTSNNFTSGVDFNDTVAIPILGFNHVIGNGTSFSNGFFVNNNNTINKINTLHLLAFSPQVMRLTWTAPSVFGGNILGYKIERESPLHNGFLTIETFAPNATTYFDSNGGLGLTPATQYGYRVEAVTTIGTGPNGNESSTYTLPLPPTDLHIVPSQIKSHSLEIAWNPSSGHITGYEIQRESPDGGNFTVVATTGTTLFNDTGLFSATQYNYIVRAFNEEGFSLPSNNASAFTNEAVEANSTITGHVVANIAGITTDIFHSKGYAQANITRMELYNYSNLLQSVVTNIPIGAKGTTTTLPLFYQTFFSMSSFHTLMILQDTELSINVTSNSVVLVPKYFPSNAVLNYTVHRNSVKDHLAVQITRQPLPWQVECEYVTTPLGDPVWHNYTKVGYYDRNDSVDPHQTVYGTCFNDQPIIIFTSLGNNATFASIFPAFGTSFFGIQMAMLPFLFLILFASIFTKVNAPIGIIMFVIAAGIMWYQGWLTFNPILWTLMVVFAIIGVLVGRRGN